MLSTKFIIRISVYEVVQTFLFLFWFWVETKKFKLKLY